MKKLVLSLILICPFTQIYSQISENSTKDEVMEYLCKVNGRFAAMALENRQERKSSTETYKILINQISHMKEAEVRDIFEDEILRIVNHAYTVKIYPKEEQQGAIQRYEQFWFQSCMSDVKKLNEEMKTN